MAGPYGRMCRDLFGQSLHIKGVLVLDDRAKLTVPNACVNFIDVSGNVRTSGIMEHSGQEGIRIIGNLCMDDTFVIKSDVITETVSGKGIAVKNSVDYNKFGFGKLYLSSDFLVPKNGNTTKIVFQESDFESSFTTSNGLIHPGGDSTKTFVAPTTSTLVPPIAYTFGNVVVETKLQLQANIYTGSSGDTLTVLLTNNGNITAPLVEYIHTVPFVTANNSIQTISMTSLHKIAAGDQLDYYLKSGNVSGLLCININSGKAKSFASFDVISLEP